MNFRKSLVALGALALLGVGYVAAQVTVAVQPNIATSDLVPTVPRGIAQAQQGYVHPYQIAGAPGYQDLGAATTGNTYAYNAGQVYMIMRPVGTLAAVTLTAEANPSDGQRECFMSTQTTTSLTWNANTGQTIANAPSAGVANVGACMLFNAALAAWERG